MRRRYAAERRFRLYGVLAVSLAGLVLVGLLGKIAVDGWGAFYQYVVTLEIDFNPEQLGVESGADRKSLSGADYAILVKKSLRKLFPDVTSRRDKRALNRLVSGGAAAARFAAACPSGDRAMHSDASSAVAKLPRCTFPPPRHTCASYGLGLPGLLRCTPK